MMYMTNQNHLGGVIELFTVLQKAILVGYSLDKDESLCQHAISDRRNRIRPRWESVVKNSMAVRVL
jgi:hypothetical protein